MPRRKLIRPAEPLTPPEPGSLEETIYLGDCASAYAKPLAQLRWYDRRGELQMAIQRRDEAKRERERELETKNAEINPQSPAVPPVPPADVETERRVAKMLKQLEELGTVPVPEVKAEAPADAEFERRQTNLLTRLGAHEQMPEPAPATEQKPT